MRLIDADTLLPLLYARRDRYQKWLDDAKKQGKDFIYNDVMRMMIVVNACIGEILNQPTIQHWIPVSERLPSDEEYRPFSYYDDGVVLYCTKEGKVGFGWYYRSTHEWANEDDNYPGEVIAWMPLPELYQEEKR